MDVFEELTRSIEQDVERDEVLRQICSTAATLIPQANLISLWNFDADFSKIQNIIALDVEAGSFSKLADLQQKDFPEYFSAIVENELIVASDARTHPMTRCFNEAYFIPNDIFSLLDFILHKDFKPVGVICCESRGKQAHWIKEDEDNLRTLAVLISFYFEI